MKDGAQNTLFNFDNSYARLPVQLFAKVQPQRARKPQIIIFNSALARALGLKDSELSGETGALWFSGSEVPPGAEPLAQAYAGHQFGHFNMLGDGRAILLGEHVSHDGQRWDIHLKGSGRTPFSRRGDGLAALAPMLREYLISEALYALGIPTTRSLAVTTTGDTVYREVLRKGAVLTRIAKSHIRVGTFQFLATMRDPPLLKDFTDYTINRHDPQSWAKENPYLDFLQQIALRHAQLVAKWMGVGFIHGVMNTDNMLISGETLDFGPCAFLDAYHSDQVFSSIDREGRYSFGNQPRITFWNLTQFAETLVPLIHPDLDRGRDLLHDVLGKFPDQFESLLLDQFRMKLGLFQKVPKDAELIGRLLKWMQDSQADFTNTFRYLSRWQDPVLPGVPRDEFLERWHQEWMNRLKLEGRPHQDIVSNMEFVNPAIIPRNHQVDLALKQAEEQNDLQPFHRLLSALQNPFTFLPEPGDVDFRMPPQEHERIHATFCGT